MYTEKLPERLNETIAHAQAQLRTELRSLHTAQLTGLSGVNDELHKQVAALDDAAQSAKMLARQLSFPDVDEIRAMVKFRLRRR